MVDLAGRHAVVTGGGTGLGAAIARTLAGAGARVTVMGRRRAVLDELVAQLPGASAVCVDVTDEASVERAFAEARALAPVGILVNNAGGADSAPFRRLDSELWQRTLALNLTGTYLCCRAALADVTADPHGRIINVASTAGLKGYAYTAAYCASKHGVVGLTRALAVELARSGATVNALCPGFSDTELVDRSLETVAAKTGMSREAALGQFVKDNPQGRLVRPDEVAAAALWLCDANSAAINGQAIAIAGGEVM